MTKLSTHKRWKGCCMLHLHFLCNGAKSGRSAPVDARKQLGQKRRFTKIQDGW